MAKAMPAKQHNKMGRAEKSKEILAKKG